MSSFIADRLFNFLLKYNDYTEKDKIVARYGLQTLMIIIEKTLIVLIISSFFRITKEVIIFLFAFGFLRTYTGGLHLNSGKLCTILSLIIFFSGYLLSYYMTFNNYLLILYIPIIINILIFAPADTSKKPIIKKELRKKRKINSLFIIIIYFFLTLFIENNYIKNVILFSSIYNCISINPITYKIFKQTYNNYLIYEKMKEGRL